MTRRMACCNVPTPPKQQWSNPFWVTSQAIRPSNTKAANFQAHLSALYSWVFLNTVSYCFDIIYPAPWRRSLPLSVWFSGLPVSTRRPQHTTPKARGSGLRWLYFKSPCLGHYIYVSTSLLRPLIFRGSGISNAAYSPQLQIFPALPMPHCPWNRFMRVASWVQGDRWRLGAPRHFHTHHTPRKAFFTPACWTLSSQD